MNIDEYQAKAHEYIVPGTPPEERVMGIFEESGEIAGAFKRLIRGDIDIVETRARVKKELGDLLWYISQVAADNAWLLSEIAKENLDKLESRKLRNAIMGDGDNR